MAWIKKRTLPSGSVRLYVFYKFNGRRHMLAVRDNKPATARKMKSKIETAIAEGTFLEKEERSTLRLGEWARQYLATTAAQRPKSDAFRRERLTHLLRLIGEATPIEEINETTVARYVERRLAERYRRSKAPEAASYPVSAGTVNLEVAVLRHMLHLAYLHRSVTGLSEYRLAECRPLDTRGRAREPVFLPPDRLQGLLLEARRVAEEMGTVTARQGFVLTWLAAATGARIGELLALRDRDISRQEDGGAVLTLRTTKRGPIRAVAIRRDLAEEIERLGATGEEGEIFVGAEGKLRTPDGIKAFWGKVRRRAGLRMRFHDLRHTFASIRAGSASLREVQRILGHSSARTTEKYAHFALDQPPGEGLAISPAAPGPRRLGGAFGGARENPPAGGSRTVRRK